MNRGRNVARAFFSTSIQERSGSKHAQRQRFENWMVKWRLILI